MIIGIDESGRGPWAGPLVCCAVALDVDIAGLTDSKLLTSVKRERLSIKIKQTANSIGVGWISSLLIDEIGLTQATSRAMRSALSQIKSRNHRTIIDGNINYIGDNKYIETVVGGDKIHPAVSAASIIAKVSRDRYMLNIAKIYPGYGFENNKGYGTREHINGLNKYRVCDIHRRSFKPVKELL